MSPGPATEIDPLKVADEGGLGIMSQTAEFLSWSDSKLKLQPRLAESWKPNADGSVWTFKIRQGVKFHDGTPMTARGRRGLDQRAVRSEERLQRAVDVRRGALEGLGEGDPMRARCVFELDAPNGNFPYLLSSDNYNAIIVPKDLSGKWEKTFPGTGPWKLDKFTPNSGVSYVKNPDYWDKSRVPKLDRQEVKFYSKEQAQILALQSGDVDVLVHFSPTGGKALLNDPNITVIELRSAVHREVHMRNDKKPFDDKRVRQAMALAVDRKRAGRRPLRREGRRRQRQPVRAGVPVDRQERRRSASRISTRPRQLHAAGRRQPNASVTLNTWDGFELPDLAQLLQNDAAKVGIDLKPNITPRPGTYYGDAVFGKSPWLDSVMGITDYGHRGVPNVFLDAPLHKQGHLERRPLPEPEYDKLVKQYIAALDLAAQRRCGEQIQELLLDETPIIYPVLLLPDRDEDNVGNIEVVGRWATRLTKAGFDRAAERRLVWPWRRFIAKRLGARADHAVAAQPARLLRLARAARRRRAAGARPVRRRRARSTRSTTSSAPTSRSSTQYWNWVSGFVHGDLGTSVATQQPVGSSSGPRC